MSIDNFDFKKLFLEIGIDSTESSILITLITDGSCDVGSLSRKTKIKRSTIYSALERLIQDGLISRKIDKKIAKFSCIPPEILMQLIYSRAESQFLKKKETISFLTTTLSQIQSLYFKQQGRFTVEVVDSENGVYSSLTSGLMSGDFFGWFDPKVVFSSDQSKEVVKSFLKSSAKSKNSIREFYVPGPEADWYKRNIKNPNHTVKPMQKGFTMPIDIIVSGEDVYFLDYPPFGSKALKITSGAVAKSLESIFNMMWG